VRVAGQGGVGLAVTDFGGPAGGPGLLLLHGLMGRASTWWADAQWLRGYGRVVAYDARGHGRSAAPAGPYDRAAFVGDAAAVIRALDLAPAVVIGHSMGGLTAWQLAGQQPDLVRGVVIGDMNARTGASQDWWRRWIADWPLPFPSLAAVRAYFGADGDYFTEVMAEGPDGYRPLSRPEVLLAAREHWDDRDHRPELARVRCPALVVAGARTDGDLPGMREMAALLPDGRFALVDDAGHVVHWDNPGGWRAAVAPFVRELTVPSGPRGVDLAWWGDAAGHP
jgi:pimeloyl-ACP methyl ester carboxylesterase